VRQGHLRRSDCALRQGSPRDQLVLLVHPRKTTQRAGPRRRGRIQRTHVGNNRGQRPGKRRRAFALRVHRLAQILIEQRIGSANRSTDAGRRARSTGCVPPGLVPVVLANRGNGQLDLVIAKLPLKRAGRMIVADIDDVFAFVHVSSGRDNVRSSARSVIPGDRMIASASRSRARARCRARVALQHLHRFRFDAVHGFWKSCA